MTVPEQSLAGFVLTAVDRAYYLGVRKGFHNADDFFALNVDEARMLLQHIGHDYIPNAQYYRWRDLILRLDTWLQRHEQAQADSR